MRPLATVEHAVEIMPREANAAHDVGLEQAHPVRIALIEKPDRFVDAEIVDEDIDGR